MCSEYDPSTNSYPNSITGVDMNANIRHSNYFNFWWNSNPLPTTGSTWANVPTLLNENTGLKQVELIRYSKNPYMLQGVNKYKRNGEMGGIAGDYVEGLILISALEMDYQRDNKPVLKNLNYSFDQSWIGNFESDELTETTHGYPITSNAPETTYRASLRFNQNIFTLSKIDRVPIEYDENRKFNDTELQNTTVLGQSFEYDYLNPPSTNSNLDLYVMPGNYPAMKKITNELGGVKEIEYYDLGSNVSIVYILRENLSPSDLESVYYDFLSKRNDL